MIFQLDFSAGYEWLIRYFVIYGILTLRYIILAGLAFLIFYSWRKHRFLYKRIQNRFPENSEYWREMGYSLLTMFIFAGIGLIVIALKRQGYTQIYNDIDEYGWTWFFISLVLTILLHDTWFYWTHRFMHIPKVFKVVHKVHHLSHNPSPWAAFSFHPLEAVIEAGIFPLIAFLLPVHPLTIFLFLLYMTIFNVLGHLGYELYPRGFVRHPLGKWHNTSTHHNMHHRYTKCNYGLYFNIWDQIMGTNHKRYVEVFEEVAGKKAEKQIDTGAHVME